MEIQWNYDSVETGTTISTTTDDIGSELKREVKRMFNGSQNYQDLDLVSKYQQVFETLTFLFEDHRDRFEEVMTQRIGDLTPEQLQVEAIVFCSWLSIEVMTALSKPVSMM